MNPPFWRGRRVLITGHTGFKGGWLSLYLHALGAEVHGYALSPPARPSLFEVADVQRVMASSTLADVRDAVRLRQAIREVQPDVVFHLAAQALVRLSYAQPIETFEVNVMGTAHLLEALRGSEGLRAVVNITTDKCYENHEGVWGYRESEPLGGYDPYSASKACSEIVSAAYRRSFLAAAGVSLATARAGNVIGGGDWAADRLLPDLLGAIRAGRPAQIRNPGAIRPWQHVLEPLSGYLLLGQRLCEAGEAFAEAWNFGPAEEDARPVSWVADRLVELSGGSASWRTEGTAQHPHEAQTLRLDCTKAHQRLAWRPRWKLAEALDRTVAWYRALDAGEDMHRFTLEQIRSYGASEAL